MKTIISLVEGSKGGYYLSVGKDINAALEVFGAAAQHIASKENKLPSTENGTTITLAPPTNVAKISSAVTLRKNRRNTTTPLLARNTDTAIQKLQVEEAQIMYSKMSQVERLHYSQRVDITFHVRELLALRLGCEVEDVPSEAYSNYYNSLYRGYSQDTGVVVPKAIPYTEIGEPQATKINAILKAGLADDFIAYLNKRIRTERLSSMASAR